MSNIFRDRALAVARKPLTRWIAMGLAAFFILFGLVGYLVLPGIVKSQAEKQLSAKLNRAVSIEKVSISPYTMTLSVFKMKVMEPAGDKVFVAFDELKVNASIASLFRLAPVVQHIKLINPYVHLVRTEPNRYSIDDILAMIASQPPSDKPARFSLNNIQVEGGLIEFEDLPEKTNHAISELKIGVPFVSSLPSQVDIFVEPYLSAKVNGAFVELVGKTVPFAESKQAFVDLAFEAIELPKYIEYLPFEPRFKLPSGKLDMRLTADFRQRKDEAPTLIVKGAATLKSLALTELNGKPMVKIPSLAVTLGESDVAAGNIDITRVALDGPELNVIAEPGGAFNLMRLAHPAPKAPAASARENRAGSTTPALRVTLREFSIREAALKFEDALSAQPVFAAIEKFSLDIRDIEADLGKQEASIAEVASNSATFAVIHSKGKQQKPAAAGNKPAARPASHAAPFAVTVAKVTINDWQATLEDRNLKKPAVTTLSPLSLSAQGMSTKAGMKGTLDLKAAVNKAGALNIGGTLALSPLQADLKLDLKDVDVLALQPYFTDQVNLLVTSANVSTSGSLQLSQANDGTLKGEFKGNAALGKVATVDKVSANDFVRWDSLSLNGVQASLSPFSLTIDRVALSDFFARIIVSPQGRINLQDVARAPGEERKSLTDASVSQKEERWDAPEPEAPAAETAPAEGAAKPKPKPAAKMPPIRIKQLTMQGGKVRFTDNYIKPNYNANMVGLGGTVTGLSSDPKSTATVNLRGRVNSAPLTIAGKINPLKGDLFLDLKAQVKGMELAPLSAYSGKYAGYGITKGQLSFDVAYKVEDRKLSAENRLILDQLTFGEKVESPQATKLPVLLAVSLLKDRNGVIDIKLPISGSLDDPKFSVGGIIVRVIVNLLTKAITAPFALLGSMFGGGEELGWLEFDPGRYTIPAAGEAKLTTLAKALNDRPGLKLEITGRTDPSVDREGLARASIDRKVQALKLKDMVAKGQSAPEGKVEVSKAEYPALLKRVYHSEKFKKPRNVLFLEKDLPVPEMEKLMIENAKTTDDDLVALGNQRAQAVKEWLVTKGQVPTERVFILASKGNAAKDSSKAKPSRVDFSLR